MAGAAARLVKIQRVSEADGEGTATRNIEAAARQCLIGATDRGGDHGHAGTHRHHGDTGLSRDEAALATEGSLGEYPHDAAVPEHAKGALHGAGIGTLEADRDRSDAAMKGWMQRARVENPRHHEKADGPRHCDTQHHAVEVVVVVGRQNEGAVGRQPVEAGDFKPEESAQQGRATAADELVQGGEARGTRPGSAQSRRRHDLESARFVAGRHGYACVYSIETGDRQGESPSGGEDAVISGAC